LKHIESIGKRIEYFSKHIGLNQSQLGEEIGFVPSVISRLERDKTEPSARFYNAMMLCFGANPEWIKTGEGDMFISPEDYISRGIELLGAETMSKGFLNALKNQRFAEFQTFLSMDKFRQELKDDELHELLQLVSQVWQKSDKRNRKFLEDLVRVFPAGGGKK
jgi:Helix-turn-helix.